ncbi:HET-domain-containing protein, partial [Periconia macrospinosa]
MCELCRILDNFFTRVPNFDAASTEIKIAVREIARHKDFEYDACCFRACGAELALAPLFPVVTTDDGEPVHAFAGRVVLQLMNPLLVKDWVARCEKHVACRPEHSTLDFDFSFRLIDVQEGRLVDAPRGARYVALSYVWGGVKQVMLNKITQFAHVGDAVRAEGRIVPRTIRDAIRLCQIIGERYLWTDSLCIMQDDDFQTSNGAWSNADKMAQIPKMDIIYGASSLTVISACGTDSNAGLPGVHLNSSRVTQTIGKIGDQIFVSLRDDPMDPFWSSTWCQRAWT